MRTREVAEELHTPAKRLRLPDRDLEELIRRSRQLPGVREAAEVYAPPPGIPVQPLKPAVEGGSGCWTSRAASNCRIPC